jgi:hypothetical protein
MDQVSINKPTSSSARPSKIYPNLDFWFENKPSGNPVLHITKDQVCQICPYRGPSFMGFAIRKVMATKKRSSVF